jgi:Effector protein
MKTPFESKKPQDHPSPCLCGQCLVRQFDGASWRERDRTARKIISAVSLEDLCRTTSESRYLLREVLSLGYAPQKDKVALEKLLTAELLVDIPADKLVSFEYQRKTVIKGGKVYIDKLVSRLDSIAALPIGQHLLQSLAKSGRIVTIVPGYRANDARPDNYRAAVARGKMLKWRDGSGVIRAIRGNGEGSDTTIKYNPDLSSIGSQEPWQKQPPEIWLAHELIHADDAAYGRMDPEFNDGIRNYERQAIGLPPYDQKQFTENKMRAAWSEPQLLRPRY